jgi:hypothetical protein
MKDLKTSRGGSQLKDFLSAVLEPLQTNTDAMKEFETEYTKRAKFNGQKIVLQEALNDIFGVTVAPFILIELNESIGFNSYFYNEAELSPVYFKNESENDPHYNFNAAEITSDYDFIVKIPSGIHTAELERRVRAEVNLYKLVGKTFDITTY